LFKQYNMNVTGETDIVITGIGEGGSKDTLEQCAGTLIGKNPFRIEAIWQEMYIAWFYPPGREKIHALGALDLALWDIKGKALKLPAHQLLGGSVRNYCECYATGGGRGAGSQTGSSAPVTGGAVRAPAGALQQRLNADTSDNVGPEQPCPCGQTARYVDRRDKTFTSVLRDLTLKRAYYHCAACKQGFCPRDRALGMDDAAVSPGVLRMLGSVAAEVSFDTSSGLLWDLAGLRIGAKQVERMAERLGAEMAEDERQYTTPVSDDAVAPTLYLNRR